MRLHTEETQYYSTTCWLNQKSKKSPDYKLTNLGNIKLRSSHLGQRGIVIWNGGDILQYREYKLKIGQCDDFS